MQPSTDHERFIFAQVGPRLRTGEEILATGYLVRGDDPRAGGWFLALTMQRLIKIQTRDGTFSLPLTNEGITEHELREIREVAIDDYLHLVFEGGVALSLSDDYALARHFPTHRKLLTMLASLQTNEGAWASEAPQTAAPTKLSVTSLLIGTNVLIFLLMVSQGVSFWSPNTGELVDWGANFGPMTTGGELWRLFTCTFIHIGIIHIGFNMWVLSDLGKVVEHLVGPVAFISLYVFSGLCGSLASTWWNPVVVSAGASGAVFGTAGAFGAIILLSRGVLDPSRIAEMKNSIGGFIVYNLLFGFSVPGIDQAAHIGGLLGGALCGVVLAKSVSSRSAVQRKVTGGLLGLIAIPLVLGIASLLPNEGGQAQAALEGFAMMEKQVLGQLNTASQRNATDAEITQLLESELQPAWRDGMSRLAQLKGLPDKLQKRVNFLIQFATLRDESWTLMIQAERKQDRSLFERALSKEKEAEALMRSFSGSTRD
jgi:rhomboid protease GluP